MPKVEIEIPKLEFEIISECARKLGLPVKQLIQQELDAALLSISVWIQRTA
jgi:flagellar biosynthesis regulator FlaF